MRVIHPRFGILAGLCLTVAGLAGSAAALAPTPRPLDPLPPGGPAEPAPSPDAAQLAFSWAGDLWVVAAHGGVAARLTDGPEEDARPVWSPDGGAIAFARREEERWNLWCLDLRTARLTPLTRHDAAEYPSAFTPDGRHVLFHGARDGVERVYRVPREGGPIEPLLTLPSSEGVLAPDGTVVFVRAEHPWWRRGARAVGGADLWIRRPDGEVEPLTSLAGPELWPRLSPRSDLVYYVAEESFQRNVWQIALADGRREQVTAHRDAPVLFPRLSADGQLLAYEQGGRLWTLRLGDPEAAPTMVDVRLPVAEEPKVTRSWTEHADGLIAEANHLWLSVGGDLFVADLGDGVEAGIGRRETGSGGSAAAAASPEPLVFDPVDASGFREWGLAVSPRGNVVLAASDRGEGGSLLRLDPAEAPGTRWSVFREDPAPLDSPVVSPDGAYVAYVRRFRGAELRLAELAGKRDVELARAVAIQDPAFSPDGRWLAFAAQDDGGDLDVYLVSLFGQGIHEVSAHPARDFRPRWTPDGRWLLFLSDRAGSLDLYGLPTRRGGNRLLGADADSLAVVGWPGPAPAPLQLTALLGDEIDFMPTADGRVAVLALALGRGALFLLPEVGAEPTLATTAGDLRALTWSPGAFHFLDAAGRLLRLPDPPVVPAEPVVLPFRADAVHDPAAERRQIVRQAWTALRDGFYQEGLHLANWPVIGRRTEERGRDLRTRGEVERLLLEMAGELDASHLGVVGPGPTLPAGLWGLTMNADAGRLRIAGVIPGGPGDLLGLRPGDLLFSVGGVPVDSHRSLEVAVPVSAGATAEFVWENGAGEELRGMARAVDFRTVAGLRFAAWEQRGREAVRRRVGDRVIYLALPTIDRTSLERLRRELAGAGRAGGLLLDLRENVGGDLPEEFLRQLVFPPLLLRQPRGQVQQPAPRGLFERPIVVLVGERTGSAAELVAQGLAAAERAHLVGRPTLGAVIGADEIELQLGLRFRIPRVGWYTLQGENLEGRGVQPDFVVTEMGSGDRDLTLERGLDVLLEELRRR